MLGPVRMVVVKNESRSAVVEIREVRRFAPPGRYQSKIKLLPGSSSEFPASQYCDRNFYSKRPSTIIVLVNGIQARQFLRPETFVRYVKILFYVDDSSCLTIKGIEPQNYEFCRYRGFGFLGRQYEGRTEVLIPLEHEPTH